MGAVYRAYSTSPTGWGVEKAGIRLFGNINSARRYAARLAEGIAEEALQTDDVLTVEIEDLATRGHHYKGNSVRTALLRMVKKVKLRRIKEMKGNKEVYLYCNP